MLSTVLLLPPSSAYLEVDGGQVDVRVGWAFRATFSRKCTSSYPRSSLQRWADRVAAWAQQGLDVHVHFDKEGR